jgi:large subunit ribosomal protein L14e
MFEIGRVCLKTAGRDAGKYGAVIKQEESQYVVLDGFVRRRKVNIKHLEPSSKVIKIKEDASTDDVVKALEKAGFEQKEKAKPKYEKKEKVKSAGKKKPSKKKKGKKKEGKEESEKGKKPEKKSKPKSSSKKISKKKKSSKAKPEKQ